MKTTQCYIKAALSTCLIVSLRATHLTTELRHNHQPKASKPQQTHLDTPAMKSVPEPQATAALSAAAHPLDPLSGPELERACAIVKNNRRGVRVYIKSCQLREPVSCVWPRSVAQQRGPAASWLAG